MKLFGKHLLNDDRRSVRPRFDVATYTFRSKRKKACIHAWEEVNYSKALTAVPTYITEAHRPNNRNNRLQIIDKYCNG
jgi:hypothetical protein